MALEIGTQVRTQQQLAAERFDPGLARSPLLARRVRGALSLGWVALAACGPSELALTESIDETDFTTQAAGGCTLGFDCCFRALSDAMSGKAPNMSHINASLGSSDPLGMFTGGGSENHAVACRVAKYYVDHDPAWLSRYFQLQLDAGSPHFLNRETFSNTYSSLVIGGGIAALRHGQQKGHTSLTTPATEWLKRYWAHLALAATEPSPASHTAHNRWGSQTSTESSGWAYSLGLVGSRSYVNGHADQSQEKNTSGGAGLQRQLLAVALEHPSRSFKWSALWGGYYSGFRVALQSLGYEVSSGGVNLLARSVPASHLGLTDAERSLLRGFIQSNGTTGAAEVLAMVKSTTLRCTFTVLRTEGGVISWMGTSAAALSPCGDVKGGPWAIMGALRSDRSTVSITRSSEKYGNGDRGTVWREGNQICASSGTLPKVCTAIPSGALRYEIQFGPGGAKCVAGNCGAGSCTPTTCAAQGKNCGTLSDGCGGTLNCGGCSNPQSCGGGGTPNVCGGGGCTPTTCAAQGSNCGTRSDGCGGTLNCGACTSPQSCGGGGTPNVCGGGGGGGCQVQVVPTTFSALQGYHGGCDATTQQCRAAIARFCNATGCWNTGFGPVDSSLNTASVTCLAGSRYNTTYGVLRTQHSGCDGTNLRIGGACNAATHRFCRSKGAVSGFGPSEHHNDSATVDCVPAGKGQVVDTTYSTLRTYVPGCNGSPEREGPACNRAIHRFCRARGAVSGFGPVENYADRATVTCVW